LLVLSGAEWLPLSISEFALMETSRLTLR